MASCFRIASSVWGLNRSTSFIALITSLYHFCTEGRVAPPYNAYEQESTGNYTVADQLQEQPKRAFKEKYFQSYLIFTSCCRLWQTFFSSWALVICACPCSAGFRRDICRRFPASYSYFRRGLFTLISQIIFVQFGQDAGLLRTLPAPLKALNRAQLIQQGDLREDWWLI